MRMVPPKRRSHVLNNLPPVRYDMITLNGGLDLVTPTLSLKPGVVRDGVNYECSTTGGYTRIQGYERFDGRASPSAATYGLLTVAFSGAVAPGDSINGQTSGATGTVIAVTGTQIAITRQSLVFSAGENLRIGATVFGTLTSIDGTSGTPMVNAAYMALAANVYRSMIGKPSGSGPLRGVIMYAGTVYAFRDNVGGTACNLWKSTASGWSQISMVYEVSYTVGSVSTPVDGATLTQGGVTATVRRVMNRTGAFTTNDAIGRFVISAPSGGNFAAGSASLTGGATVTLGGVQTSITMLPGGHYELVISNFGGSTGSDRVYGADGVNRGFEFDGTYYCPIETGMTADTPKHVISHKNYLFYSYGASVQWSGIGQPYTWSVVFGAGEFSAGETVTNFCTLPGDQSGGALLIQTRNNTKILYGSSSLDWSMVSYNVGIGALHYTSQNMAGVYTLDDRGIIGMNATLAYGNFDQASLTPNLRPFFLEHRINAQASCVNREKSQYRVFFNDGWGLYATIVNDKYLGSIPVYFPDPVFCAWDGEDGNGNVVSFVGSESGYVYQLDRGTSFDGDLIASHITLNYNAIRGPRILKRFRKAAAEITGSTYALLSISYSLGYGKTEYAGQATATYATSFSSASWDSGNWDTGLTWDGSTLTPSEIELTGTAENIAMTFSNNSDYTGAFTLNGLIVHYTPRRGLR